jgi:NAD+ synthetase
MMPSQFSSQGSIDDSIELGKNLGIELAKFPIQKIYDAYLDTLSESGKKPAFSMQTPEITEENLQPRTRGNLLMALSNKFGWLVLSTGNKSELSVGYCTLYGDMAGGFSPLADQWKTQVYELAHYVNQRNREFTIPRSTLEKPPSAELRPDQKDTDSLPPYELLDLILELYIEKEFGPEEIEEKLKNKHEFDKKIIHEVTDMVNRVEYKRKQMPLGIKTSQKAFGSGRRWPIAAKNL